MGGRFPLFKHLEIIDKAPYHAWDIFALTDLFSLFALIGSLETLSPLNILNPEKLLSPLDSLYTLRHLDFSWPFNPAKKMSYFVPGHKIGHLNYLKLL